MDEIRPELQKAVALHYDGSGAPKVIAKGSGSTAEEIKLLAEQSQVPTCENAVLADVLSEIELGESIPQTVYLAVAHIIAFAYQIKSIDGSQLSKATAGTATLNTPYPSGNNRID